MIQKLAVALCLLTLALPLRADEDLQNGDFADGINHWYGDGRSPADYDNDNPLQTAATVKGLIVPLKHTAWSKVQQDFHGKLSSGILTVTYKTSADFAFSTNAEDYKSVPAKLGWGWKPFGTPPGSWMVFFSRNGDTAGNYYKIKPDGAPGATQTMRMKVPVLTPFDSQTITLAFPPGTGTVFVLSVSLSDQAAP